MCRFSIFMFTVGNEAFYVALPVFPFPAAQAPPQATRQAQTPRAAPAPHSSPAHPTRAVQSATRTPKTPQRQAAAVPPSPVFPTTPSSHRRRPQGRRTPTPLPYSHLIQSATHRQIGRKRQQHQIYPHRRRQAERDRSHRQSFLLLHAIALPVPVVQESVCRGTAFYIQTSEKSAQKSAGHSAGAFASG